MTIKLSDHFDATTLQRGRDYARRGLVEAVEAQADGLLTARVENGQGSTYRQRVSFGGGRVDGGRAGLGGKAPESHRAIPAACCEH